MHVFGADGAGIGGAQLGKNFAQAGLTRPDQRSGFKHGIEIGLAEAVVAQIEFRDVWRLPEPERIEPGDLMRAKAISIDQLQYLDLLVRRLDRRRAAVRGYRHRGPHLVRETTEFIANPGVRNVLRYAVHARQGFEKAAPGGSHGGGIAQILFVEILEVRGVARRERRRTPQGVQAVVLGGRVRSLSIHGSAEWRGNRMCRMFKSILAGLSAAAVAMARNEKPNPLKNMGRILGQTA